MKFEHDQFVYKTDSLIIAQIYALFISFDIRIRMCIYFIVTDICKFVKIVDIKFLTNKTREAQPFSVARSFARKPQRKSSKTAEKSEKPQHSKITNFMSQFVFLVKNNIFLVVLILSSGRTQQKSLSLFSFHLFIFKVYAFRQG